LVVQVDDEADRHLVVFQVIHEAAAAGPAVQRPALGVDHQARLVPGRIDLPEFLDADAEFLRIDTVAQVEFLLQLFRQRAAYALGNQRVLGAQFDARRVARLLLTIAADAHVAGRDTDHFAPVAVEHFGRGEAREDLDAELFRLAGQPAADIAERDDVVAVI